MDNLDNEDNLDKALTAAGFGCFNIITGFISLFIGMASIFCTTSLSYAMTSMGCDLSLTNVEKGRLHSMTYLGMIAGALFWALISDNMGRRPVIIICHVGDAIFGNILALGQQFTVMCICKFLCGLCISGGYSSYLTYLAEVTLSSRRTHMMFFFGVMLTVSSGVLPVMAILILPNYFKIVYGSLSYTSWQLYLTLSTIPSVIAVIAFCFMPESPKFDIHRGNNDRAKRSLQKIQFLNRTQVKDMPDISIHQEEKKGFLFDFGGMIESVRKRHAIVLSMLVIIEVCILMCQNTIRLWQPTLVKIAQVQGENMTFCSVIEQANTRRTLFRSEMNSCVDPIKALTTAKPKYLIDTAMELGPIHTKSSEKQNYLVDTTLWCVTRVAASSFHGNIYIFLICLDGFVIALLVAGHYNVKQILVGSIMMSSIFISSLLIAKSYFGLLTVLGLYLCVEYLSAMAVNNIAVLYFPTVVRNTFLGFIMFSGRLGSTIGNHILPPLMSYGCIYIFGWLLGAALVTVVVSILLPNPKKESESVDDANR